MYDTRTKVICRYAHVYGSTAIVVTYEGIFEGTKVPPKVCSST